MRLEQKQIQTLCVPNPLRIENPVFRKFARNLGFNPDGVPVARMAALRGAWEKSEEKKTDDKWNRERGSELRLFLEMQTRGGWEDLYVPEGFQVVEDD